jgi:hypothetical protein
MLLLSFLSLPLAQVCPSFATGWLITLTIGMTAKRLIDPLCFGSVDLGRESCYAIVC